MLAQFYDAKAGGFFQTDGRDPSVIVRAKEDYDGAEPSGNSMAALLLLRLAQFTDRVNYREAAENQAGLQNQHAISIAVEPVARFHRMAVSVQHKVFFRQCGDQHEQR